MVRVQRMRSVSLTAVAVAVFAAVARLTVEAEGPEPAARIKFAQISPADMKQWLGYLASDDLQGRQVFTEGYGLAASYVADHLKAWGVTPTGDAGTYFENVKIRGYKVTRNSSITIVSADGTSKTFKHGDHVTFTAGPGGKQTLTFKSAEFIGYGQAADLRGHDVKDALVVWMLNLSGGGAGRAGGRGGAGLAINTNGAGAAIGYAPAQTPSDGERALAQAQDALQKANEAVQQAQAQLQGRGRGAAGARGRGAAATPDFTTAQRVDAPAPPQLTGDDTFFEALFAGSPVKFAELRSKAQKGEALGTESLHATITIAIDNTFEPVSEQRTRNVVGVIPGSDPMLKDTYVMFSAHLDHVGYSQTGSGALPSPSGCRVRVDAAQAAVKAAGRVVQNPGRGRGAAQPAATGGEGSAGTPAAAGGAASATAAPATQPFDARDKVNNGADDDGSGSTALLAIAKAFATGPKPKRSVVFVWHAGEEAGLQGSRFNADFPIVPLDHVQAVLNMDMVGRDDCNNIEGDYTNTVFVVGADRISTDLHNLIVKTNTTLPRPLTLDYELNDPADPEGVYTRSDHFSYARKGIPITFFTTGLHPDYHRVTDSVDKIVFEKMARIAQLVYQTGFSIANDTRALTRDNKGSRTGYGSKAEVIR